MLRRDSTDNDPQTSSESLLDRYVLGDDDALRRLYVRHGKALELFVNGQLADGARWISRRSPDVCADTWIAIAKSAKNFEHRSSFLTWACKIALRACANHTRTLRAAKERQAPRRSAGEEGIREGEVDRSPPVPDEVGGREFSADLEAALAELPASQRTVFLLRHSRELSWDQIASIVGVPRSTLQDQMKAAASSLRHLLRKHTPERHAPCTPSARSEAPASEPPANCALEAKAPLPNGPEERVA